ncbi:hypothetical protein BB561_004310 [Smittium simulii]|uniref:MMS19 nucleotide excision repair protein n=1 Tax=Smittium simulii TaxID=133385 RepID=A0A2T9YH29_9FUNG|nr:hypothetical protein BB561_004310 [Smittium simulii]
MNISVENLAKAQIEALVFSIKSEPKLTVEALEVITKALKNKKIVLLNYVAALESYLTSQEASNRVLGMQALVKIIEPLSVAELTPTTAKVLIDFLLLRTSDAVSISSILDGMSALLNLEGISSSLKSTIVTGLLERIHVQSFQYNIRNFFFQILEKGLTFINEKTIDSSFFLKVVDAANGERDPRNLSMIFDIILRIIHNFDISTCYNNLFDCLYSYFPISYRPSSVELENTQISNLKNKLNLCFSECPDFGQVVLEKLVEKLVGASPSVKEDIYKIFTAAVKVYSNNLWDNHLPKLLPTVYEQLFSEMNDSVEIVALEFLSALTVLPSQDNNLSFFNDFFTKEVSNVINNFDTKNGDVLQKIISAVCISSNSNFDQVVQFITNTTFSKIGNNLNDSETILIMKILISIIEACITTNKINTILEIKTNLFLVFSINSLVLSNSEATQKNVLQIAAISAFISAKTFLTLDELETAFITLSDALLDYSCDPQIRLAALEKIRFVAPNYIENINSIIIKNIFNELNNINFDSQNLDSVNRVNFLCGCLESFSMINSDIFKYTLNLVILDFNYNTENSIEIVDLIKNMVINQPIDIVELLYIDKNFMQPLAVLFLSSEIMSESCAVKIAEITSFVFREMDLTSQIESLQNWSNLLEKFILQPTESRHDYAYIFLSAIVCSSRANLPFRTLKNILSDPLNANDPNSAISKAIFSTSQLARLSLSQIVSSILNKSQHDGAISAVYDRVKTDLDSGSTQVLDLALWVSVLYISVLLIIRYLKL